MLVIYLSLCDDVEGAALLSLPDDVFSSVVVFLRGKWEGREQQSEPRLFIDLTTDCVMIIPGRQSPLGWEPELHRDQHQADKLKPLLDAAQFLGLTAKGNI